MNISIRLETVFKSLAGAVLPLALWLINLNLEVSELTSTVSRLEKTQVPAVTQVTKQVATLESDVSRLKEKVSGLKVDYEKVSARAAENTTTITEMRVSLKYIEEGIRIIKSRVLGPSSSD